MKSFIFILLLSHTGIISCLGQCHYDRITVYAIPIETSFAADNIDANYIRAHATFKFTSTHKDYIRDISKLFFEQNRPPSTYSFDDVSSTIRIVIDFIDEEKIESFVLINAAFDIFITKILIKNITIIFRIVNYVK
ncbi:MAG: hypothetical protein Kow0075_11420 [Salibacteraceae bacterium]